MSDKGNEKLRRGIIIVIVNILMAAIMSGMLGMYVKINQKNSRDNEIESVVRLVGNVSETIRLYLIGQQQRIDDVAGYQNTVGMNKSDLINYLRNISASTGALCELIDCDTRRGYAIMNGGNTVDVDYSNYTYDSLGATFENAGVSSGDIIIDTTPEFTDAVTKLRSVAFYALVTLMNGDMAQRYMILLVVRLQDIVATGFTIADYKNSYAAIVKDSGEYITKASTFKSTNIYEYFDSYNDLTIDERESLINNVKNTGNGYLKYKNSEGRNCIYVYSTIPDTNNWYCFFEIPESSFGNTAGNNGLAIMIAILMLVIFAVDGAIILNLYLNLKRSLNQTIVEAENAERASLAKSEFLSRMSHDMRTPMNGIIGIVEIAQTEAKTVDEMRGYLKQINNVGHYLMSLINDTLDLKKIESEKMELKPGPMFYEDIEQLVNSTIRPKADEKLITLDVRGHNIDGTPVLADKLRTGQIILNVLNNSIKYTNIGGHVSLDIFMTGKNGKKRAYRVVIKDNGIGMSEEFQKRMFEPFECENPGSESTGLGLAIVYNLVKLMGGQITVNSKKDVGTETVIEVELPTAEEYTTRFESSEQIDSILKGKNILLAEDNEINAMIATRLLNAKEMTVEHASDGEAAVRLFAMSEPGYYDAVLMDIRMPVLDGHSAAARIRSLKRPDATDVPIAAMTANAFEEDRQKSLNAGMNEHIAKPVDPKVLYEILARLISDRENKAKG